MTTELGVLGEGRRASSRIHSGYIWSPGVSPLCHPAPAPDTRLMLPFPFIIISSQPPPAPFPGHAREAERSKASTLQQTSARMSTYPLVRFQRPNPAMGDGSSNSTSRDRKTLTVPLPSFQGSLCSTRSEQNPSAPWSSVLVSHSPGVKRPRVHTDRVHTCPQTDAALPAPPSSSGQQAGQQEQGQAIQ